MSGNLSAAGSGSTFVSYDPEAAPTGTRVSVVLADAGEGYTQVALDVDGLLPDQTYAALAHVDPCGETAADAGGRFQGAAGPGNEVSLDLATDGAGAGTPRPTCRSRSGPGGRSPSSSTRAGRPGRATTTGRSPASRCPGTSTRWCRVCPGSDRTSRTARLGGPRGQSRRGRASWIFVFTPCATRCSPPGSPLSIAWHHRLDLPRTPRAAGSAAPPGRNARPALVGRSGDRAASHAARSSPCHVDRPPGRCHGRSRRRRHPGSTWHSANFGGAAHRPHFPRDLVQVVVVQDGRDQPRVGPAIGSSARSSAARPCRSSAWRRPRSARSPAGPGGRTWRRSRTDGGAHRGEGPGQRAPQRRRAS